MSILSNLVLALLLLSLSANAPAKVSQSTPQLTRGEVDLGSWDDKEAILVNGEWMVLPDQFIDSSNYRSYDFGSLPLDSKLIFQESKALFVQTSLPDFKGFRAAYVILVKNSVPRSLGIEVEGYKNDFETNIHVPAKDFFFRLDMFGDPHRDEPVHGAFTTPIRYYNLDSVGELGQDFYVIINSRGALVNNVSYLGVSPLKISSSRQLEKKELIKRAEQFVIFGIYAMLMIYSLTIFVLRRDDRPSLTVGFLSLFLSLRYMATERLFLLVPALYPLASLNGVAIKLFYAFAAFLTVLFIHQNFGQYVSKKFRILAYVTLVFGLVDSIATWAGHAPLSMLAGMVFLVGFTLFLDPYYIYVGWKARRVGGLYSSISLLLFTAAMLNDFYQAYSGQLNPMWLGHYGMLSLAIGFALVNAKIFSNTYKKSVELNDKLEVKNKEISQAYNTLTKMNAEIQVFNETLRNKNEEITYFNKNLENLVKDKTQEITALLDHIPQGVLSLEVGGVISRDYSRHLVDIIEDTTIAGRSFKELVLDRSDLSADLRDQAWQTLQVVIGEADINFEANLDKLPTELNYQYKNTSKWLKITWNVETTDFIVKKVLVTMLDVSKEKVLQKEAEVQRQEFEIIRELVEAGARKIGQYFVSASALLHENEKLLEKPATEIDHPDIQCMFINMHTVKGGARTLGLKDLARVFHEVEEYYQDILRHGLQIDKDRLVADMQMALQVYRHYQSVNARKLNRSEDFSKVTIDREFVEAHYQILRDIVSDLDRKDQPLESIIQRIHSQKDTIVRLIFDQLPAVFDEYKAKAEKIAKEVNKPKPHLDFKLDQISITPDMKAVLDNCMIHLLRNALCHGIESPDERVNASKSEAGTITVKSQVQGSILNLEISDDGRGLAIHKLREKGQEGRRLPETATVQEVAELIFAPGVTTAKSITHISGRGVGMDAVRKFLEQRGGGIEIRLGNPKDESRQYYNFKFLIHIPMQKAKVSSKFVPKIA